MTLFLASYLQPWVASLIVAGVLVILVTLCACQGEKDTRFQEYGIPGKLSSISVDSVPQPTVDSRNGRPVSVLTETSAGSGDGKPRTVTERALPDIPRAVHQPSFDTDTDQTPDSGSECYATVTKREVMENGSVLAGDNTEDLLSHVPPQSPVNSSPVLEGPGTPSSEPSTSQDLSAPQELQEGHPYAQVRKSTHHPYSRLLESGDSDPTDAYQSSPDANPREVALPTIDNEDTEISGGLSEGPISSAPFIAGQAVAGNIPSAEIPYMTPPLAMAAAQSVNDSPELTVQQEIPYTVISVREPLERVRMQTRHHMRRRQHSNQGSSLEEPEGYYMEVPDDEQTYAEIDSGQNSAESSSTYDLIEPRNSDFPPDPPTVESLKFVAKAHSRQASIASVSSFGSAATSTAAGATTVASTSDGNSKDATHSMMEKSRKSSSNVPATISGQNESTEENTTLNLEDLYAKVHKKRVEGTMSVSGIEEVLRLDNQPDSGDEVFASARTSWSSTTASRTPNPQTLPSSSAQLLNVNRALVRRHSAEPTYSESNGQPQEPCYALVTQKGKLEEPNYEQIKKEEPSYAQVKRNKKEDNTLECGYERIKRNHNDSEVDPGYERIKRENADSENEPGYELVRQVSFKESADPGYECVRNLDQSSSDPGYEKVPRVGRSESDIVDPGYERVRRVKRETDRSDPDYECIPFGQQTSDNECVDPGYEQVGNLNLSASDQSEPGYDLVGYALKSKNSSVTSKVARNISVNVNGPKSPSTGSENSVFNAENPVYESSGSELPLSYNDSFVCDKISLNVPYSDSSDISADNFVTVRVKQSSDSESSVSYSASIVEVECGSRSPHHSRSSNVNGIFNNMQDEK